MSSFSPVKAGLAGYGVIFKNPVSALVWFVILGAYSFGYAALGTYTLGEVFQVLAQIADTARESGVAADQRTTSQLALQTAGYSMADIPMRLVILMFVVAAVVRAALHHRPAGFAYLRIGGDELRLFVTLLVVTVVTIGVVLACALLTGLCAAIAAAIGGRGALMFGVIPGAIVGVCALIFFSVKLSLAVPGTVAQKQIRIFESWSQTKGHFWKILGSMLIGIIAMAPVAALAVFAAVGIAMATGAIEAAPDIRAFLSYPPFTPEELFSPARLAFYALTGIPYLLFVVTTYAVPTAIYHQIGGEGGAAIAVATEDDDDEDWDED